MNVDKEIKECENLWGKYSCDCLHYEWEYWGNMKRNENKKRIKGTERSGAT